MQAHAQQLSTPQGPTPPLHPGFLHNTIKYKGASENTVHIQPFLRIEKTGTAAEQLSS
jgi:hypothetical protein